MEKENVPVKGATLDFTPPIPRPSRTKDPMRPPRPAPASIARGIDVTSSNRTPER